MKFLKKLLALSLSLLFPLTSFAAFTNQAIMVGGGGTTVKATSSQPLYIGSLFATSTGVSGQSIFKNFTFVNATGTSATTTNFFSTTASSSNLFTALLNGAGLGTCNGSTSGLSWASGLFGCVTITPAASSITSGATLSKVDDTNVTLTLGGSPTTALLAATSLTLGWSGTLADARVADNLTISGGTVNNTPIGASTPSTAVFSNATSTNLSVATNASTTNFWVSSAGGSTGCAQFSTAGLISNTGTACGTGSGGANSKWATSTTDSLAIYTALALSSGVGTTTPRWTMQLSTSTGPQLALSDNTTNSVLHWTFRNAGGLLYVATSSTAYATSTTAALTITANAVITPGNVIGNQLGALTTPSYTFTGDLNNGFWSPAADQLAYSANGVENFRSINGGWSMFGTTTNTLSTLTVASSTAPQIHLSDGIAADVGWIVRNAGGNLYFATTSTAFASTSLAALQIMTATGYTGIGTGTPYALLSVGAPAGTAPYFAIGTSTSNGGSGLVMSVNPQNYASLAMGTSTPDAVFAFNASSTSVSAANINIFDVASSTAGGATNQSLFRITTAGLIYAPNTGSSGASQTGYWCYDTSGQLIRDSAVCLVSALKYKKDIKPLDVGLKDLIGLDFVSFYKKNPLDEKDSYRQMGVIADWVAKNPKLNEMLVTRDSKGEIQGFRYDNAFALTGQAIKELNMKVERFTGEAKKNIEDQWQWICILLLGFCVIMQQIQIKRLKK